jgi:1,4-dihydroxy-2-naphthoate octaprenyltransferase
MPIKLFLGPMRGPFLLLTPVCVGLGVAAAQSAGPVASSWQDGWLALLAGLAAHISVNALNEYVDFKSGLDERTVRTPFSGGSGTLPAHPGVAPAALAIGLTALLLTCAIGLHLLLRWSTKGLQLAPLGLLGVALVAGYSPWITRSPWLCLIAPGLGFGPLMVAGTQFVLLGHYVPAVWWLSAMPFFLVNNLLLLNQFPDVEPDRAVGRQTLPILLGRPRCVAVLGFQWLAAYGVLAAAVWLGALPIAALAGLLSAPLALVVWRGVHRHADDMVRLVPFMGMNVALTLVTPVLVAVGLLVSS